MRRLIVTALACAALLPAPAGAATPMKALIVQIDPAPTSLQAVPADEVAGRMERAARQSQSSVLAQLAVLRREGHVRHIRSLWIANAVAVTADASAIAVLRARSDVRSIEADSQLPIQPADAVSGEPGIAATGAPVLWGKGIDGRGITVATLDTGVDLTHAELAGRYRGGSNSWFDPYGEHAAPMDLNGHGTQVMGVMVAGNGIGMAPGARFIAARVFNDAGVSTDSAVHLAFQWVLDPDGNPATNDAPNVVNASWGAQLAACDLQFQPDLQALRSAHILPVFAAGNNGPAASSDTSPGNLPEAFAVGATSSATTIASFSSIGPSRCGGGQFPALVAPGTGIRSTDRFGFDATGLAGTSFSAPHVAGALALLLQISPHLTADEQASLLTQSAHDLGQPGPDSTFGAGSLDAAAAALRLSPTLDIYPPVLSGAAYVGTTVQIHAVDASSAIAGAEWWAGADPGVGAGQPMAAADGSFDSPSEDLVASVQALPPGLHQIGMRARDAAGNWSPAALLAIDVPSPPAAPLVVASAPQVTGPFDIVVTPLRPTLRLVASDGFEHGLAAWPRRAGAVAAVRAAAMAGAWGLRTTSLAGAQASLQRPLPHVSDDVELAFDLNPRTFSSAGAWIDIAAITGTGGRPLASVQLRTSGRQVALLRLRSVTSSGAFAHSRPHPIGRRATRVVLSIDPARATLAIGGAHPEPLARAAKSAAAGVAIGPWRGAPGASTGYLDIDSVTVRIAPLKS
jgi:subtilisin family serine protease